MSATSQEFTYDDGIVRQFFTATLLWGLVGMAVGILAAMQLADPAFNFGLPWLTFGRIRPLHTNAVIFAFGGNAIFCGVYHSMQRLLKARPFSGFLSQVHFWGWQGIIVAAAVTLPLGFSQSKEYAELEWPVDIAIALVWVVFAVNFFGTIARRRERHLYVSIWFYIATVITIALLHIFNNLVIPAGWFKSYSVYAGVQDAFMQWWYGHNAVGFLLTTPFLGLMYYYMPKAANRPVFSYKLSILHFWTLIFIYIWAGPHHLHYTALPEWCATVGMLFSLMLWMPSWGGMINGLLTLRGAWHKVAEDPILKFFVVAITFYGMSTFEGPMMSVKTVNMLSHYTDWTIAHVHGGGLGWVGFLVFGMLYWLAPRIFQTKTLWNPKLAEVHFWVGTLGILLYIIPIYVAGITQGLMWSAMNEDGTLAYEFVETTQQLKTMYWARVFGGGLYFAGALLCTMNMFMTWVARPKTYEEPVQSAPPLSADYVDPPLPELPLKASGAHVLGAAYKIDYFFSSIWHRRWERLPLFFTVAVTLTVISASLFEMIPTLLYKATEVKEGSDGNIKTYRPLPYTPLELAGRDIYVTNGCYNCHSQMVRPIWPETKRYGEYSRAWEFIYDHPFQWGSRRIGPDLAREGGKMPHAWHLQHFRNPQEVNEGSIMPVYAWLLEAEIDYAGIPATVEAMAFLGVPYTDDERARAVEIARAQAVAIAAEINEQLGSETDPTPYPGIENKQVVALIAYLQKLGTDINRPAEAAEAPAGSGDGSGG